jgi:hypothetical protein
MVAAVFAAGFMTSVSAQDFLAVPGTPAVAFPKLDRPVANIVNPIWHDEKERDDAGEASQLVRHLHFCRRGFIEKPSGALKHSAKEDRDAAGRRRCLAFLLHPGRRSRNSRPFGSTHLGELADRRVPRGRRSALRIWSDLHRGDRRHGYHYLS